MEELELFDENHNPNKICNIIKVNNIQQSVNNVSGKKVNKLYGAKEMFAVYTDDNKYSKLYTFDEADKILPDLLSAGYISYSDYHGSPFEGKGEFFLKRFLNEHLMEKSKGEYEGVAYRREELAKFRGELCIVHGGQLHWGGQNLPAFRYSVGNNVGDEITIEKCVGDVDEFKIDIKPFLDDFIMVQLIFAYMLSGAIRQVLSFRSARVDEYGLVTCITGEPGSGKTTATVKLQNILFGKGMQITNNSTEGGLYKKLKKSGICPLVRDDSSTDTKNSKSHLKDKVREIYDIASGQGRTTANCEDSNPIFAPFIESREGDWGLADILKSMHLVEGYKYRVLELYCNKGDLTKDAQAAREFDKLSSKYSGMATIFLDYLVDNYTEEKIQELYDYYIKRMEDCLSENGLEDRYANRNAVILTAAKICGEAYGLNMKIDEIMQTMIDSILSFESRIIALPENVELTTLYKFFTTKDEDGKGINDEYIVDKVGNYRHAEHYVTFMERKEGFFYIPSDLLPVILYSGAMHPVRPGEIGYERTNRKTDYMDYAYDKVHLTSVLKEWVKLGIIIPGKDRGDNPTKTTGLNGKDTSVYQFEWKKIAKQFGSDIVLDKSRFVKETAEESLERWKQSMNF